MINFPIFIGVAHKQNKKKSERTKSYERGDNKFLNLTNEDQRPADEDQREQFRYEFISEHKVQNKYKKFSFGILSLFFGNVLFL